jgi:hypothetical protein
MLPQLEALLRASPKVIAFQVLDSDVLAEGYFLYKIRCVLGPLQLTLPGIGASVRAAKERGFNVYWDFR